MKKSLLVMMLILFVLGVNLPVYWAQEFPIKINDKIVPNSLINSPFPSLRDLLNGLVNKSANSNLIEISLPGDRGKNENGTYSDNVAVTNRYAYYEGQNGQIMQSPLSDPSHARVIYQLPFWAYGDGTTYVYAGLDTRDGVALLTYHQGGATMGTDYLVRLNDDGTTTLLNDTRFMIKTFGEKSIKYWVGPMPGAQNLFIKTGDSEWLPLGSPNYIFGWAWESTGGTNGGYGSRDAYLIGDDLYILGFDMTARNATTGIYKVNVNTNQTTRVSEKKVFAFQIEGDYIYYSCESSMYRFSIPNCKEELLKDLVKAPNTIKSFTVLNGNIYWQDEQKSNLYNLDSQNANPGAVLDDVKIAGDNNEYLVCSFQAAPESKYLIMIFNKIGDVVFKTSDKAYCRNIYITGNTLYFYNVTRGTVCVGQL